VARERRERGGREREKREREFFGYFGFFYFSSSTFLLFSDFSTYKKKWQAFPPSSRALGASAALGRSRGWWRRGEGNERERTRRGGNAFLLLPLLLLDAFSSSRLVLLSEAGSAPRLAVTNQSTK
jgi:hypothetical protein